MRHSFLSSLAILFILAFPAFLSAEYQPSMSCDKRQYTYSPAIEISLTFKGIDKDREYFIIALDGYNRVWLKESYKAGPGEHKIKVSVPRMKGFTVVLMREDGKKSKQISACRIRLDVRGMRSKRSYNFTNMPYGGSTDPKRLYKALRNIGCNGGMAYMWHMGSQFAINNMDYYHEYCSFAKRDIQNTSFQKYRNVFEKNVFIRGTAIRTDVLGHDAWTKKALKNLDPDGIWDAKHKEYLEGIEKMIDGAEKIKAMKEPWLERLPKDSFSSRSFIHKRPVLGRLNGRYMLMRPYNWFDKSHTSFIIKALQNTAYKDAPNQAIGYSIGDEISNTHFVNPFDYDYSPITLNLFREWLKTKYKDLDALNKQWGTKYETWEAVIPYTTDETRIVNNPEYRKKMLLHLNGGSIYSIPWKKRQTPESRNYSSWSDFRSFQDVAWVGVIGQMVTAMRKIDPGTPAGVLGAQAPSAFGGYDYDLLFNHSSMNWIEAYDIGCSKEIIRSFNKRQPLEEKWSVTRTHFPGGLAGVFSVWYYIFMQDQNNVVWTIFGEKQGGLLTDNKTLKLTEKAVTLRDVFRESIDGIGKAFFEAKQPIYPIALYLSQRSIQAHWMIDSETDGATWIRRFGSWESQNSTNLANYFSWTKLFEDLGFQYDFFGKTELLNGGLKKWGYKVLVLPKVVSLSAPEAAAIKKFAEEGGIVIADTMTGLMDNHCKTRPDTKGILDDFFGIKRGDYNLSEGYDDSVWPPPCFRTVGINEKPLNFISDKDTLATGYTPQSNFYVAENISSTNSKALALQGDKQALFLKNQGKGKSLYLGASILRYNIDRLNPGKTEAMRAFFKNVLTGLCKQKPFGSAKMSGKKIDIVEFRPYQFGEAWLYGIGLNVKIVQDDLGAVTITGLNNINPQPLAVELAHSGHIYSARDGKYLGKGNKGTTIFAPTEGLVLSVLPYKIEKLNLEAKSGTVLNGLVKVDLEAKFTLSDVSGKTAPHLIRFMVFNPKGNRVRYNTDLINMSDGIAKTSIYLSPNDVTGTWQIQAFDVHTGQISEKLKIQKKEALYREVEIQEDPFYAKTLQVSKPESEFLQKPGIFISMKAPVVSVKDGKIQVSVKILHLPEASNPPDGTLTVYDKFNPENKKVFTIADILKDDNRTTDVAFTIPMEKAQDMQLVAEIKYDGALRTDSRDVKLGKAIFGTPKMEASLADPLWKKCSVLTNFRNFESGAPAKYPTKARIAFDDKYLYVLVDSECGGADKLVAKENKRDGNWWGTNSVDILIGKTQASTPKFNLNMCWNGALADTTWTNDAAYDGFPWDAKTKKTEKGWIGLARIPLSALGCGVPANGDVWLMNFTNYVFKNKQAGVMEEYTQYGFQGKGDFNLSKFGQIVMLGNPGKGVGKVELPKTIPSVDVTLDAKVVVDGVLNEATWKKATPMKFGYVIGITTPPADRTIGKLAADKENLYFAFEVFEQHMKELKHKATKRDAGNIWDDDVVELFIAPKTGSPYFHVYINSDGVICDAKGKTPGTWDGGFKVKIVKGEKKWVVEGSVPFKDLGIEPNSGTSFRLNLNRTKPGKDQSFWEETSWSPTFKSDSHVPERFGTVKLK